MQILIYLQISADSSHICRYIAVSVSADMEKSPIVCPLYYTDLQCTGKCPLLGCTGPCCLTCSPLFILDYRGGKFHTFSCVYPQVTISLCVCVCAHTHYR